MRPTVFQIVQKCPKGEFGLFWKHVTSNRRKWLEYLDDASNATRKNDKSDEKIERFHNEIIDDTEIIQNY